MRDLIYDLNNYAWPQTSDMRQMANDVSASSGISSP